MEFIEEETIMVSAQLEAGTARGLAGIGNREEFEYELLRQRKQHERRRVPLSLLLVEIDYFRQFNAVSGLPASDECLDCLAEVLADTMRRRPEATAFVRGPEQFAVLLPETDAAQAEQLAEEIRFQSESLVIPHPRSPVSRHVTVSVGTASEIPARQDSASRLLTDAEAALAHAKERGRNQVGRAKLAMSAIA